MGQYDAAYNETQRILQEGSGATDVALFNLGMISAHSANPKKNYTRALSYFRTVVMEYPQSQMSEPAKTWLIQHGYDEQMGARPMARMIQEHIKKPLADEVLFGKLKGGGLVRVVLVKDEAAAEATQEKIGFEYVEGPVTPKPEKLPGARKRTVPRKPKPSGPSGGSKGPASRGPLVKV